MTKAMVHQNTTRGYTGLNQNEKRQSRPIMTSPADIEGRAGENVLSDQEQVARAWKGKTKLEMPTDEEACGDEVQDFSDDDGLQS